MDFYCNTCHEKLTVTSLREARAKEVRYKDGEEALPTDCYLLAEDFEVVFNIKITHVVHTASLRLVNHRDPAQLRGCCGPGRLDCYNQVCAKCSEPIGLLFADCWAMHFTAINADKLSVTPKW